MLSSTDYKSRQNFSYLIPKLKVCFFHISLFLTEICMQNNLTFEFCSHMSHVEKQVHCQLLFLSVAILLTQNDQYMIKL